MSFVIQTSDLTRTLEGEIKITLVNKVNIKVKSGEFVAITGPSGSGKSSLLYLLGLLDQPTSGKIFLHSADTTKMDETKKARARLEHLGFVFQFHFLLPEFTALENVMLPMQRLGKLNHQTMQKRAQELLCKLGMAEQLHKIPRQLSGGQSQRVAIARAMANSPALIMGDEPTGNLDSHASQNVQDIFRHLAHGEGKAVIVVTHDREFAQRADRIIHIVDGFVQ